MGRLHRFTCPAVSTRWASDRSVARECCSAPLEISGVIELRQAPTIPGTLRMSKVSISGWQLLRWFVVLSTSLLIAYVGLTREYGIEGLRLRNWGLITLAATLVVWGYACWCERRGCHKKGLAAMGLLSASTLGTLVIADTLYNVTLNRWATPLPFSFDTTPRGLGLELQLKLPRFRTAKPCASPRPIRPRCWSSRSGGST